MTTLEAIARAICASCGENPDHVDASGEPRWKAYIVSARAAIDAYLSKMPRAWAVKTRNGIELDAITGPDYPSDFHEWFEGNYGPDAKIVPVAIVELEKGE